MATYFNSKNTLQCLERENQRMKPTRNVFYYSRSNNFDNSLYKKINLKQSGFDKNNTLSDVSKPSSRNSVNLRSININKSGNDFLLNKLNNGNKSRKQSAKDFANLSHSTFQNISFERKLEEEKRSKKTSYYMMFKSKSTEEYRLAAIKADRNKLLATNNFKGHLKTEKKYEWAKKEKWEITKTGNFSKELLRSVLLSSSNKNNLKAREVVNYRKIKPKEEHLIESFCFEEDKKLKEMRNSSNKLPFLNSNKLHLKEVKNTSKTRYMGERYNPHNFEVEKIKKNTCSLKSFTFKK
jgi:hypothetical protein